MSRDSQAYITHPIDVSDDDPDQFGRRLVRHMTRDRDLMEEQYGKVLAVMDAEVVFKPARRWPWQKKSKDSRPGPASRFYRYHDEQ